MRILIVEDEFKLAEALAKILTKNRYSADIATDGHDGLDKAMTGIYDLILLDIMLPRLSGLQILRRLRLLDIRTPVILLTAKDEVADKVAGLDAGADDYITKPFSGDELLARIRALFRRGSGLTTDNTISFESLSLNQSTYELVCGSRSIKLGLKEMGIAEMLIHAGKRIVSKEEMLKKVWGYDTEAEFNNVEVYISLLRKKLAHIHAPVNICTVRGVGYNLVSIPGDADDAILPDEVVSDAIEQ